MVPASLFMLVLVFVLVSVLVCVMGIRITMTGLRKSRPEIAFLGVVTAAMAICGMWFVGLLVGIITKVVLAVTEQKQTRRPENESLYRWVKRKSAELDEQSAVRQPPVVMHAKNRGRTENQAKLEPVRSASTFDTKIEPAVVEEPDTKSEPKIGLEQAEKQGTKLEFRLVNGEVLQGTIGAMNRSAMVIRLDTGKKRHVELDEVQSWRAV